MNKHEIQSALDPFWASFIQRFEVDLVAKTIELRVIRFESGLFWNHKIIFEGVVTFFFVGPEGDIRYHHEPWERAELTAAHYNDVVHHRIVETSDWPNSEPNYAQANFVLEIWDAELFIEADAVTIDDKRYEVGYPHERAGQQSGLVYSTAETERSLQPEATLAEGDGAPYQTKDAGSET